LIALILLIVQKEIKSPKGTANTSVKANTMQVTPKPSRRLFVTVKKSIENPYLT
jgi:hypothetical protein